MNIDVSTGLPELPERYFWRVAEVGGDYAEVQIRRKMRIGSVKVDNATMYRSNMTPKEVLRLAKWVHAAWAGRRANPGLLGDYPPKKLEMDA